MRRMQAAIKARNAKRGAQRGFTLAELTLATVVLMFGVVAAMQLAPASVQSNLRNHPAVAIAQRELDQMVSQPLSATQFTDVDGHVIALGDATRPDVVLGGPVQVVGTTAQIDFTQAAIANYNFTYVDPNDAGGTPYEVRWAVITNTASGLVVSKRFIVGAWRRDPARTASPVTIEGLLEK